VTSRRAAVFDAIWRRNLWGGTESRSGLGSGVARTAEFRAALEAFLSEIGCRSLYDAPCGDFVWMRHVRLPPGAVYIGADIVPGLIAEAQALYGQPGRWFRVADIVSQPPPAADVWLCRESLFHLSLAEGAAVLDHWRRSSIPWFLSTTTPTLGSNPDIVTGGWRPLNLERPPFGLPPPALRLPDGSERDPDKIVGAWRLADLNTVAA